MVERSEEKAGAEGERRGKQTWVEHAAHIIALACVDIHGEQQGASLLLQVPRLSVAYLRPP